MSRRHEFYITITSSDWHKLRRTLLTEDGKENAAVLLCGISEGKTERRLLVRRIIEVPQHLYDAREELHLRVSPRFYDQIVTQCIESKLNPVIVHSHTSQAEARYSVSDDFGERRLLPVLSSLLPNAVAASLLLTPTSVTGRQLIKKHFNELTGLKVFGPVSQIVKFSERPAGPIDPLFDRQTLAFGEIGQKTIQALKVGIVGVGGIG